MVLSLWTVPTIFHEAGFRIFFYSNERNEPCHVHVIGHGGEAKIWIPSLEIVFAYRLNARDLRVLTSILKERIKEIEEKWHDFFKSSK